MVNEIYRILKTGGKIYIDERLPEKNKTIHQGCKKPMIGEAELIELMEKNGFKLVDKKMMKYTFPDQVYCFKKV
jgi:predicted methyltransferase